MSDNNTIKQLRNEVQLLRDELAIMKRKYEDIIYNLDTDNFSQRVVKQGKDMYTKIEQTAGEISLQAEKVGENTKNLAELQITAKEIKSEVFGENEDGTKTSRITQTAEAIRSELQSAVDGVNDDTDEKLKNYSTITQTAEQIETAVEEINTSVEGVETRLSTQIEQTNTNISLKATEVKEYAETYVTNKLTEGDYVTNAKFQSKFDVYADGIYAEVSETREYVDSYYNDLSYDIDAISSSVSSIRQTANSIQTKVTKVNSGQFTDGSTDTQGNEIYYTLFEQYADSFTFDGRYMYITASINICDNYGNQSFSIFHNEGNGTSDGFRGTYICASGKNLTDPLFLGRATQSVYLYDYGDDNLIATQGWVRENAGSGGSGGTAIAVFG